MSWLLKSSQVTRPIDGLIGASMRRRWPAISDEALQLLMQASQAVGDGHSALDLSTAGDGIDDVQRLARNREVIAGCPAVGTPGELSPFILDDGRLYLRRFHQDEVRLAQQLQALSSAHGTDASVSKISTILSRFFPQSTDLLADNTSLACLHSLISRLTVVLGGPGTGKTTLVARLLALHQALAQGSLSIALCAPTGRAAARVAEALHTATAEMEIEPAIRAALPTKAMTLHRLLGARGDGVRFQHDRENRIPFDLVVLDEASMVDQSLFVRLLEALPEHARIIVLGDPDQLEAIESGAVLAELSTLIANPSVHRMRDRVSRWWSGETQSVDEVASVAGCIVRLDRSWRFSPDSGIGRLASAIRTGDSVQAASILMDGARDLTFIPRVAGERFTQAAEFVRRRYDLAVPDRSVTRLLEKHQTFRILAATQADTAHANGAAAAVLGQRLRSGQPEGGLPFVCVRNDPLRGLNNGDTGVFLTDEKGVMQAWLPARSRSASDATRRIPATEMGEWLPAYAMTVHRAQGAEFDDVFVIAPAPGNSLLTRSWLYTAVSRARSQLVLMSELQSVEAAISQQVRRVSGLASRLAR